MTLSDSLHTILPLSLSHCLGLRTLSLLPQIPLRSSFDKEATKHHHLHSFPSLTFMVKTIRARGHIAVFGMYIHHCFCSPTQALSQTIPNYFPVASYRSFGSRCSDFVLLISCRFEISEIRSPNKTERVTHLSNWQH